MKTLLLVVIMLSMWYLPTPVQSRDVPADLKEKNINERVRANQRMNDRLSAQQGRKGIDDCMKQKAKNDADMKKTFDNMNKNKINLPNTNSMPELNR